MEEKARFDWKIVVMIAIGLVLGLGLYFGVILLRQSQDIRREASQSSQCPAIEACPGSDNVLRNCHPPEADGTSEDSICSRAGRIEFCGTREYCCPSPGLRWTTDLTLCVAPTPTPTPTPVPTPTPTPTPAPTPESTPIPTPTPAPTSDTSSNETSTSIQETGGTTTADLPVTGGLTPTVISFGAGVVLVVIAMISLL